MRTTDPQVAQLGDGDQRYRWRGIGLVFIRCDQQSIDFLDVKAGQVEIELYRLEFL
jgi:hypothetical protein